MRFNLSIFVWLLLQAVPTPTATPVPANTFKEIFETVGSFATPVAAVGLLVALAWFFWHSKNREELTKALAEASSLAETRGKRISDLKEEMAEKDVLIGKKDAKLVEQEKLIADMELDDERRAKTEFRLRAEITDLEKQLGINIHTSQ